MTREQKLRGLIRSGKSHKDIQRLMLHFDESEDRVRQYIEQEFRGHWAHQQDQDEQFIEEHL